MLLETNRLHGSSPLPAAQGSDDKEKDPNRHSPERLARKRLEQRGKDVTYAVESFVACVSTDWIDPVVGKWWQHKFETHDHHGTLGHSLGGELIGDLASIPISLTAKWVFPHQMEWFAGKLETMLDPIYSAAGKPALKDWAQRHGVTEQDEAYQHKLEKWKQQQSENLAQTFVITTGSVAVNIATQKLTGNTHKISTILSGKLLGTAATWGIMLGSHLFLPKQMKAFDKWVGKHFSEPVLRLWDKAWEKVTAHHAPAETTEKVKEPEPHERKEEEKPRFSYAAEYLKEKEAPLSGRAL